MALQSKIIEGVSRLAMEGFESSHPAPFDSEKQTGIQHVLSDGKVDAELLRLSGQSVAAVQAVFAVEGDGTVR